MIKLFPYAGGPKMKVIILSDYFDEKAEAYLKGFCKSNYNKSGLFYQRNLFSGFVKEIKLSGAFSFFIGSSQNF